MKFKKEKLLKCYPRNLRKKAWIALQDGVSREEIGCVRDAEFFLFRWFWFGRIMFPAMFDETLDPILKKIIEKYGPAVIP